MSRLFTQKLHISIPIATGSLCHYMLKVVSVIFKTAPFSVNSSICTLVVWFEMNPYNQIDKMELYCCANLKISLLKTF